MHLVRMHSHQYGDSQDLWKWRRKYQRKIGDLDRKRVHTKTHTHIIAAKIEHHDMRV